MIPSRILALAACLSCLLAWGHAADKGGRQAQADQPIDWSGYPKPARAGDYDDELKVPKTGAFIMRYRMCAPKTLPERRTLGVILAFHGANGNETHSPGMIREALKRQGLDDDYLVVGLKSKGARWEEGDEVETLRFYEWIVATYPVDTRRVHLWGMSNGGWMVSWFGGRHHDLFAGIVRYCGYPREAPPAKDAALTQTEYYLVHGDADDAVGVDGSRQLRKALRAGGYRYLYREIDGGGHVDILGNDGIKADWARWYDSLRHKQIPPPADDLRFLAQMADLRKAGERLADPSTWTEIVRIGGAPAGAVVLKAFKAESAAVRLLAAKACSTSLFSGDDVVAGLARLAEDKDAAVRLAALEALGVAANWRYELAQTALGRFLANAKRDPADRLAASAGLAKAVALPLFGNFDDDLIVFQGVVQALDDDDQAIRTLVATPLARPVPDLLGYHAEADAALRKDPIAHWKKWFAERYQPGADGKAVKASR